MTSQAFERVLSCVGIRVACTSFSPYTLGSIAYGVNMPPTVCFWVLKTVVNLWIKGLAKRTCWQLNIYVIILVILFIFVVDNLQVPAHLVIFIVHACQMLANKQKINNIIMWRIFQYKFFLKPAHYEDMKGTCLMMFPSDFTLIYVSHTNAICYHKVGISMKLTTQP